MSTETKMQRLPEAISKAITGRTSTVEGAERKKGKFEDDMFSAGFRSGHCISPKSTKYSHLALATPECFEQIKEAIVRGFPEKDRTLLLQPVKGLDDERKARRSKLQKSIGWHMRDLADALLRREIDTGEIEPEVKEPKTPTEQILQHLLNAANTARKIEEAGFDVVEFVKQCEGAAILVSPDGANVIRGKQD